MSVYDCVNIKQMKFLIDNHDVISFDVFDTLLVRSVPKPQDVFYVVASKLHSQDFEEKRIRAEILARKKSSHEEVSIYDIYEHLDGYSADCEISEELSLLVPNPYLYDVYQYAREQNRIIICISDMYLDAEVLRKALTENGYDDVSNVYVSSDYAVTKKTGRLYRVVIDDLNVAADRVLHIGDNYYADVLKARSCGLGASHYRLNLNCVSLRSDLYRNAVMKRTVDSLCLAQQIRLGVYEPIGDANKSSVYCSIRWYIYNIKIAAYKCVLFGIFVCIKRMFGKLACFNI